MAQYFIYNKNMKHLQIYPKKLKEKENKMKQQNLILIQKKLFNQNNYTLINYKTKNNKSMKSNKNKFKYLMNSQILI